MATKEQREALAAVRWQALYMRRIEAGGRTEARHELRIKSERRRDIALELEARKVMEDMAPELYAFCVFYYIGGVSLKETSRAIDRSERQCLRYKMRIERGEKGAKTHEQKV